MDNSLPILEYKKCQCASSPLSQGLQHSFCFPNLQTNGLKWARINDFGGVQGSQMANERTYLTLFGLFGALLWLSACPSDQPGPPAPEREHPGRVPQPPQCHRRSSSSSRCRAEASRSACERSSTSGSGTARPARRAWTGGGRRGGETRSRS